MSPSAERELAMNTASDKPRSPLSGFTARVDGAHLADLIQMNCQKRTRCVFRIISGEGSGYLFFDEGQVLHAEFGKHAGMDAVVEMLSLETGTFEPSDRAWPAQPSLRMPADVLLLNAAKLLDEARQERKVTPNSQVVKLPSVTPATQRTPGIAPSSAAPTPSAPPVSSGLSTKTGRIPSRVPAAPGATTQVSAGATPHPPDAQDSLTPPHSGPILPMVHLSKTGELIASKGEASETLVETTAFTHRLACLAGEALGLGACRAVYMTAPKTGLIVFQARADAVVGATGSLEQLGYLVKKAGL
jgi:hypothetical protein